MQVLPPACFEPRRDSFFQKRSPKIEEGSSRERGLWQTGDWSSRLPCAGRRGQGLLRCAVRRGLQELYLRCGCPGSREDSLGQVQVRFAEDGLRFGAGGEPTLPAPAFGVGLGRRCWLGREQPESRQVSLKEEPQ